MNYYFVSITQSQYSKIKGVDKLTKYLDITRSARYKSFVRGNSLTRIFYK